MLNGQDARSPNQMSVRQIAAELTLHDIHTRRTELLRSRVCGVSLMAYG